METWVDPEPERLVRRALALLDRPGRAVLGIAGAPGSGKSTLAARLLAELDRHRPGEAVGVGMDAFHIGHRVLVRRGQTGIKGAPRPSTPPATCTCCSGSAPRPVPSTRRSSTGTSRTRWPMWWRSAPGVTLVVTEGNYLLLDTPPWDGVRPLLDEAWFVHLADGRNAGGG